MNEASWLPDSDPCRDGWAHITCEHSGQLSSPDNNRIIVINLRGAGATYPQVGTPARANYEQFTARCKGMGEPITCNGLPPRDCGAFVGPRNESYRLSVTDPNVCDECPPPDELHYVWAFFITLSVASTSAIALYIYLVLKWPEALKRWGSTLTIIVGHVQVLTIIGGLRLELPMTLRYVLDIFDVLSLPDAENRERAAAKTTQASIGSV